MFPMTWKMLSQQNYESSVSWLTKANDFERQTISQAATIAELEGKLAEERADFRTMTEKAKEWYDAMGRYKVQAVEQAATTERLRGALQTVLASAFPTSKDNPSMFKAWEVAKEALSNPLPATGKESLAVEGGWRPIETAQKDGTVIDLWMDGEFAGRISDCYWGKMSHCCGEDGDYCDSDWHSTPPGWVTDWGHCFELGNVTHWRPLPPPPKQEGLS